MSKTPWIAAAVSNLLLAVPLVAGPQQRPFESLASPRPAGRIDELVFGRLEELGIPPAHLSSDTVFVRRAFLDVIGTLPTPTEVKEFLRDEDPDKRRVLIDRLLARDEFPDYWAMKWGDLLRIKSEFPINLWPNAVQAYHRWVRTSIAENKPYDQFVREMLTASGSCFRVPEVNFWRAGQSKEPEALAGAVALTFLGTRIDAWPAERRAGLAAFFSRVEFKSTMEWKEEIVFHDSGAGGDPITAVFPDGTQVVLSPDHDPREDFADWLVSGDNPWFARSIANRAWFWLQGRGIVHEPDDLRPDNPAANPELLAYLAQELVENAYDLKHLLRLILNSTTYQLSSIPGSDHPAAEANFAHYPLRRLEAEVLIDALCRITGTVEEYSSAIPEPFTFVPENQRSIELADGSITSPFLELFGRPSRDTGLASERSNQPTAAQRLHLLNSSHIRKKIETGPRVKALQRAGREPRPLAVRTYLLVLSRYPTRDELNVVRSYFESGGVNRKSAAVDLVWALINSSEFLYRH